MLCVQNSETWALSQANPKTKPISPANRAVFPQKRSQFVPKTEPVLPKNGACFFPKKEHDFSQKRSLFVPKTEHVFPKNGACFSQNWNGFPQNRWQISPKSVTDFPKIGDGFPQNRWQISSKSVADFPKIGDGFPQNRWLISWEPSLVSRNPNSQSQKIPNAFLSMYILAQNTKTMRDFQPATTHGACRKTQTRVNLWISCVSTLKCICKHGMLPCASGFDV